MPKTIEKPTKSPNRASLFKEAFGGEIPEVETDNRSFIEKVKEQDELDKGTRKGKREGEQSLAQRMGKAIRDSYDLEDETPQPKKKKLKKKVSRLDKEPEAKKVDEDSEEEEEIDVKISVPKKEAAQVDEDEEEEEDGEEEEKPKSKEVEKEEERERERVADVAEMEDLTDEEKESFASTADPEDLVSGKGEKVSAPVSKAFKDIKSKLNAAFFTINKLRREGNHQTKNKLKMLEAAHAELRKKYDSAFFQETEEWKTAYEAPLQSANNEMIKWLDSHDHEEGSSEHDDMDAFVGKIKMAIQKNDEVGFYENVDGVAEYLKKGASARFIAAAPSLWKAHQEKINAFKDKDKSRSEILGKFRNVAVDRAKTSNKFLDDSISEFERKNEKLIDIYKNDERFRDFIDYDGTVTKRVADVKKDIEHVLVAREMTPELMTVISEGLIFRLQAKELLGIRERLRIKEEEVARLETKLGEKKKTIDRIKPSNHRRPVGKNGDDDDDEDAPKSASELFRIRRRQGLV
jgi:hypothetical protein